MTLVASTKTDKTGTHGVRGAAAAGNGQVSAIGQACSATCARDLIGAALAFRDARDSAFYHFSFYKEAFPFHFIPHTSEIEIQSNCASVKISHLILKQESSAK